MEELLNREFKTTTRTAMIMPIATPDNKPQVFGLVIIPNTIDMMDNLSWFKVSPKCLLHYKPMLKNLVSLIFMRMVRAIDKNITIVPGKSATFPVPMLFSSGLRVFPAFKFGWFTKIDFVPFFECHT